MLSARPPVQQPRDQGTGHGNDEPLNGFLARAIEALDMPPDGPESDGPPSPEAAFAALGDETRLAVLRTLGEAAEPLAFTELRQRVGYDTASNFSYHLDQLRGHFIQQTDRGYELRRPGERVVEAVLSGAVTDDPSVARTQVDRACPYCGAPVELSYHQEQVTAFCTDCAGVYGGSTTTGSTADAAPDGLLGYLPLPPAGVRDRSLPEIERAAWTWGFRVMVALANGVCPWCSAPLDQAAEVCGDHDAADGLCPRCGNRHAVQLHSRCRNCIFDHEGAFVLKLVTNTRFLAFVTGHGLNPVFDQWEFGWEYDEAVNSTNPFDAEFTFEIGDDVLTVTVDDELSVTDTTSG